MGSLTGRRCFSDKRMTLRKMEEGNETRKIINWEILPQSGTKAADKKERFRWGGIRETSGVTIGRTGKKSGDAHECL